MEERTPVEVPPDVLEGLEAVRDSGETNMLDRPAVASLAYTFGYPDAAAWVEENPRLYSEGVFRGFVAGAMEAGS